MSFSKCQVSEFESPVWLTALLLWLALLTESAASPSKEYSALLREYSTASLQIREADTDDKRREVVELLATFPSRFLDFHDRYPDDPIALKSIRQAIQVINTTDSTARNAWDMSQSNFPASCPEMLPKRAVAILQRDYLLSEKLVPVIDRMRYGYRIEYEDFLRIDKNKHETGSDWEHRCCGSVGGVGGVGDVCGKRVRVCRGTGNGQGRRRGWGRD